MDYALYKSFACTAPCQGELAIRMSQSGHSCWTDKERRLGFASQNRTFGIALGHIAHDSGPEHYSSVECLILMMCDQIRSRGRIKRPCFTS